MHQNSSSIDPVPRRENENTGGDISPPDYQEWSKIIPAGIRAFEEAAITDFPRLIPGVPTPDMAGLTSEGCDILGSFRPMDETEFLVEIMRSADGGLTDAEFEVVAQWAERVLIQALLLQMILDGQLRI